MIHEFGANRLGYCYAAILFRSLVETRGGMLPEQRLVPCRGAMVDDKGTALFLAEKVLHIQFPQEALLSPSQAVIDQLQHCATKVVLPELHLDRLKYIGGQELTWDLHMDVPARLEFLTEPQIIEALTDDESLQRGGHTRIPPRR